MIKGHISSRTQCNSIECLMQMMVRIKPIIAKAQHLIDKGDESQFLNIFLDLRYQMEDVVEDINSDALNREVCPNIGGIYTFDDAYKLFAYKLSSALCDHIIPGFMPYFYLHLTDSVIPYITVKASETEFINETIHNDFVSAGKKFTDFGKVTTPPQIVFVKIDRVGMDNRTPIHVHELLDLSEFGGSRYQLFGVVQTQRPGYETNVIMNIRDSKGWIRCDYKEVSRNDNFLVPQETLSQINPVIYLAFIKGRSNIETFRPGHSSEMSVISSTAAGRIQAQHERFQREEEFEQRTVKLRLFDPSKMCFEDLPDGSFTTSNAFKLVLKGVKSSLAAKGFNEIEIEYREPGEKKYRSLPLDIPPDGAEILGNASGSLAFVNNFIRIRTVSLKLNCIDKEKPFSITVRFTSDQTIQDVKDFVHKTIEKQANMPQLMQPRLIYYRDGEVYKIANEKTVLGDLVTPELFFTLDGTILKGSNVLMIRFVSTKPEYAFQDDQFSFGAKQTVKDLREFTQNKFGVVDVDLFTFNSVEPFLTVFHPRKMLKDILNDTETPLFAQPKLRIKTSSSVLGFVHAETLDPLAIKTEAFRIAVNNTLTWREIKDKLQKILKKQNINALYVTKTNKPIELNDKLQAKNLTNGVFFITAD